MNGIIGKGRVLLRYRSLQCLAREFHRSLLALGKEVATILGIYILYTNIVRSVMIPIEHTIGIEEHIPLLTPQRDLTEVIDKCLKTFLGQQVATVAVKTHLARVLESHFPEFVMGNLVDTVLTYRNAHPLAGGKQRV